MTSLKALREERLYYSVKIYAKDFEKKIQTLLIRFGGARSLNNDEQSQVKNAKYIATDSRFVTSDSIAILRSEKVEHVVEATKRSKVVIHGVPRLSTGVYVPNLKSQIHHFLHEAVNRVSSDLHIFGITGTKGKTTTTYFIHQICEHLSVPCAYVGTLGVIYGPDHLETLNTTPSLEFLLNAFSVLKKLGCKAVACECSSIGLDQGRLDGVEFNGVLFTGLGRDHLDYHGTMSRYFAAKKKLFCLLADSSKDPKAAVIVMGSSWSKKLASSFRAKVPVYEVHPETVKLLKATTRKSVFEIPGRKLRMRFFFPQFLVLALAGKTLVERCMRVKVPFRIIEGLKLPPGRFELVENVAFVDYAHSPESLEFAIKSLKQAFNKPVVTVFGCGGNRDAGKRPIMGKIASELSDFTIITSDNPRFEKPLNIINDICSGVRRKANVAIVPDRAEAIQTGIKKAIELGGYALVAGKGHENYQIIGDRKIRFSDTDVARKFIRKCLTGYCRI